MFGAGMYLVGFLVATTLAYLFFVIKSKVVISDEAVFRKHLEIIKKSIKEVICVPCSDNTKRYLIIWHSLYKKS